MEWWDWGVLVLLAHISWSAHSISSDVAAMKRLREWQERRDNPLHYRRG
jgi:hypothetical protein